MHLSKKIKTLVIEYLEINDLRKHRILKCDGPRFVQGNFIIKQAMMKKLTKKGTLRRFYFQKQQMKTKKSVKKEMKDIFLKSQRCKEENEHRV